MDHKAISKRLQSSKGYSENAKFFRKVADASEAKDSAELRTFVESLLKQKKKD